MEDKLLDQGLFCLLLSQVLLHGYAVALAHGVALQIELVASNLGIDRERHHFLIIAVIHIVNIRILGCVVGHRVLGKLVENVLIDVLSGPIVLVPPKLVVVVKSLDQLLEGVLEVGRLHELLQGEL